MAKVLVASEDRIEQDQLVATIEAEGYDVFAAYDGLEAQTVAVREHPDLILLDANLSIFNGFEAALAMREDPDVGPIVPIVLITNEDVDPRKVERYRITEVFPKTHASVDLRDLVIRLLGDNAGR